MPRLNFSVLRSMFHGLLLTAVAVSLIVASCFGSYYYGYKKASADVEKRVQVAIKQLGTPLIERMDAVEQSVSAYKQQVEKDSLIIKKHNDFLVERFNIWQWGNP